MNNLIFAKHLLETFLVTPMSITDDIDAALKSFENDHCFSTEFQYMNTCSYLHEFIRTMDRNTIYEVHEPLETVIMIFFLNDLLVIIGPFVQSEWVMRDSENLLASLGIDMSYLASYRLYKCRYSILDSNLVMRAAVVLLETAGFCATEYSYVKIDKILKKVDIKTPISKEHHYGNIEQRYAAEMEFIQMLQTGDASKAIAAIKKLSSLQSGLYKTGDALMHPYAGPTALRTTIRIAAMQTGLSPVIIDSISQEFAQKLYSLKSRERKKQVDNNHAMINEICHEIAKFQKQKHSALIRKAIAYIQLNLGHTLSVKVIADALHVSAGYLSKRFKSETGTTIVNYIMDERVKKAAELLTSTKHTIQDISAYIGYLDSNYFVKVFKSRYGITPTDYRSKFKKI